jgi:hypothetical protein
MKFSLPNNPNGRRRFVISASALVAACGGGVEVGTGGTGNNTPAGQPPTAAGLPITASGPITGFGSVIVNGIKFDDSTASIADQRGQSVAKDALRLGMYVTVSGQLQSDGVTAVASSVEVRSELKGAVSAIDLANNRLTVLGLTVVVNSNTSYDDVANLAALSVNDVIEVYGLRDPQTQLITATRIERTSSIVSKPFLVGKVNAIDLANKTLSLGTVERNIVIGYTGAAFSPVNTTLAIGQVLFIEVDTTAVTSIRALTITVLAAPVLPSSGRLEIEGVISDYQNLSAFKILGQLVDASAASFGAGNATDLKNGVIASVKGIVSNGVLKADKIEVRNSSGSSVSSSSSSSSTSSSSSSSSTSTSSSGTSGGSGSGGNNRFELNGPITAFTSVSNFVVRNTIVDASTAVFTGGQANTLAVNVKIEMLGAVNGNKFVAAFVKILK